MGLDFRHTGLPRGHTSKIWLTAGTKTAATGNKLYITAISSSAGSSQTITFPTASDAIGDLKLAAQQTISFSIPIECTSFANPSTSISIIYAEMRQP